MSQRLNLPIKPAQWFLSLRWKLFLGISLILIPMVILLIFYARTNLIHQFEQDQRRLRQHQTTLLLTLISERYQHMARLASLIPNLATCDQRHQPTAPYADLVEHLRQVIEIEGGVFDLEWDIRTVHWLPINGAPTALWPSPKAPLPLSLITDTRATPEQITQRLLCNQHDCRQYVSSPVLWHGKTAGSLVLGCGMANIMLAFTNLTGADLAIATPTQPLRFHGATQPHTMLPLLQSLPPAALLASQAQQPLEIQSAAHWYEIFRSHPNGEGLSAFIINSTTAKHQRIQQMARNSLLIGLAGLLVSEGLLLLIMHGPVRRIRALSRLLPLLAENRFETLAQRLPRTDRRIGWCDEIDANIEVVGTLNQRMAQLQAEREAAQRQLHWLADHDSLTALLNRRRFNQELAQAIEHSLHNSTQGALLFIDLDNFKDVNDTSGHQAGDRLLKRIAKKLTAALGSRGYIGRFGGDEFAMLLHPIAAPELVDLVKQFQDQVNSTSVRTGTHRHQVTASIGIVFFPEHGTDTQALMAKADLAMYQAKTQRHRGNWHVYSESDMTRDQACARVLWTREIIQALRDNRLHLYYQPILSLAEQRIWRAEGLLRMTLPDGRLANPAEFIPVAERSGLISIIDHWVIVEAIRVLAEHPRLALSVNLSAKALTDPTLDAELMQHLNTAGIDPQRLTLEITETIAIDNVETAILRMNSIHAIGCHFALDDFGSGFASYAYLKQLPVDDVKIDGSFIRHLDHNAEDRIFVKAAVEMAHAMGKKVIAEFVESEAILRVLHELEVDFAQGYYIGRPVPELPPSIFE
ncbi:EAL domain-containing protein [Rhabdochromatium marinum]|uniref:bifunctional diguanylate cyclase/phosphodiesterase n=1 Tax=Rhabdochromatium marinum TaxID=48729 RepID=UPI001904CC64|nr:EAL domain-containing protein [Rhabdochromatium marinum]MBK1649393.1 hypothetical protein [Rhabdochromatium marinum]